HFRVHMLRFFRGLAEIASVAAWVDFDASRRRKGVGARTIAKELSSLRSFAKWCRARGLIETVPDHRGPWPRSDFKALCLEPVQIDAIIAALPEKVVHGKCAGQPIRARFVFAWETALRPATIERLKLDDYDRARKRVIIRDSADKARFGREVPLTERAWKALEGVCPKSGPIFGRAKLRETLKAAAKAAGYPTRSRGALRRTR
ncbi:MAG TPA: tyrosine-type recombinase/integrase, partial [Polyangiales bacterium]|nr:tyrosine-type recombinase/integrase [Polyangiales bacterium]